jgi:hypothetical protein
MYVVTVDFQNRQLYTQFNPKEAETHKLYLDSFIIASSIQLLSLEMSQCFQQYFLICVPAKLGMYLL